MSPGLQPSALPLDHRVLSNVSESNGYSCSQSRYVTTYTTHSLKHPRPSTDPTNTIDRFLDLLREALISHIAIRNTRNRSPLRIDMAASYAKVLRVKGRTRTFIS
jgi:hypothetical protein